MVRIGNQIGGLGGVMLVASMLVASMLVASTLVACGADPSGTFDGDASPGDASPLGIDASAVHDAGDVVDAGSSFADAGSSFADAGSSFADAGVTLADAGVSLPDAGATFADAGVSFADAGVSLPDAGGGITTACTFGDGQALWRLTFPPNAAGYATVEEWDNGCDYSLANQACSLSGEPHNYANFGPGILFNSSTDFFRVRFSAAGLSFTQATLYITAHADGSGIPNAVLESPIYGSLAFAPTVPISTHRTYAVDWSDFLSPSDNPNLTAVTLRSNPTGLAVSEIQLCVQ